MLVYAHTAVKRYETSKTHCDPSVLFIQYPDDARPRRTHMMRAISQQFESARAWPQNKYEAVHLILYMISSPFEAR